MVCVGTNKRCGGNKEGEEMKTFFDFLYHLVGLMAGTGGLMAFVVGLIVAWDKNHYLAVSIFLVAVISALVVTIYFQKP